jgi:hypothetical protein
MFNEANCVHSSFDTGVFYQDLAANMHSIAGIKCSIVWNWCLETLEAAATGDAPIRCFCAIPSESNDEDVEGDKKRIGDRHHLHSPIANVASPPVG